MKVILFYHSILSCWNHGNAHFLRGVARELLRLGHTVVVYEPEDGWSRTNAISDGGEAALAEAAELVPGVVIANYQTNELDVSSATDGADLVIVHEWNTPALIGEIGRQRIAGASYTLLFHDSHHRALTAPEEMRALDLEGYDGVLVFGEVLREVYLREGWARSAFTWHEAADTALFHPIRASRKDVDIVWIGNWGDDERTSELQSYLINPIERLRLRARIYGVRYPACVREMLTTRAIDYAGWLPNHRAPAAYSRARATVHVPRRPYAKALPGIPTIRVFEALACGVPLVSAPWDDVENLFTPGADYLVAANGSAMQSQLRELLNDPARARSLSAHGRRTILARHTCAHRVDELLGVARALGVRH